MTMRPQHTVGPCMALLLALTASAPAPAAVYTSRDVFISALGMPDPQVGHENFDARAPGPIANGLTVGDFSYAFDASLTQPAIAPDGAGGQALGGMPAGVFVGGDSVTLSSTGTAALRAFGADFFYAPSFLPAPATIYRMAIADGRAAGETAANGPGLDLGGGSFFLGFIEDGSASFKSISLFSLVPADAHGDPMFLVAAYQVDNLVYAAVPEPSRASVMLLGGLALWLLRRRGAGPGA